MCSHARKELSGGGTRISSSDKGVWRQGNRCRWFVRCASCINVERVMPVDHNGHSCIVGRPTGPKTRSSPDHNFRPSPCGTCIALRPTRGLHCINHIIYVFGHGSRRKDASGGVCEAETGLHFPKLSPWQRSRFAAPTIRVPRLCTPHKPTRNLRPKREAGLVGRWTGVPCGSA
jgi:hypothetical protein